MTQRSADCSRTCFNRWSRLESVITSARRLEERGCPPGTVWSPLTLRHTIPASPSMSDGRSGEETTRGKAERTPHSPTHPPGQLSAFQVLTFAQFCSVLLFPMFRCFAASAPAALLRQCQWLSAAAHTHTRTHTTVGFMLSVQQHGVF